MTTDAERILDICAKMRRWAEQAEKEIEDKEKRISELQKRLPGASPEQHVLITEMITTLEDELANTDRPQLEVLRLDILENCGPG
jgi:uncharacterized protein YeeX (DUF496 family)